MESYLTITDSVANLTVSKSKFISFIYHVESEEEAIARISELKKKYHDASHVCYAYIADVLGNTARFSDAGEPSGTAGMPMLEALRSQNLRQALAVVVRYFGGTKLGVGGLVRAYGDSVRLALRDSLVIEYVLSQIVHIEMDYGDYKKCTNLLSSEDVKVLDCSYGENVKIVLAFRQGRNIVKSLLDLTNGNAKSRLEKSQYVKF